MVPLAGNVNSSQTDNRTFLCVSVPAVYEREREREEQSALKIIVLITGQITYYKEELPSCPILWQCMFYLTIIEEVEIHHYFGM